MRKIISDNIKKEIIEFYKSKPMSLESVSNKYGLCKPTIRKILGNTPIYSKTQMFNPLLDEDFFEYINTEQKAYFIGLIIADGNIFDPSNSSHKGGKWVSITLDDADSYMLDNFKYFTGVSTKVASDGRGSSYIAIRSNKMADDLSKYGIIPRKSFFTRFPFEIDKEYYRHVIRGIIDGDGSIQSYFNYTFGDNRNRFKHCISCCGTHRLMSEIIKVISESIKLNFIPNVYDYKNRTLSEFKISNIEDMKNVGNWLYENSTIFLSRKKESFDKFINHYKI